MEQARGGLRRRFAQGFLVPLFGFDLPVSVEVGKDVEFLHNGLGTVIHPNTVIKDGAQICQNVTIGDGTMWKGYGGSDSFGGVIIGEGATISTGAKVLGSCGQLVVGRGSVVGANAVLTKSIGDHEI